MITARVEILKEVFYPFKENGYTLCFQYCTYRYSNNTQQNGYRFIWRRPDGTLRAARGQARIPSVSVLLELVAKALQEGWGANINELSFEDAEEIETEN